VQALLVLHQHAYEPKAFCAACLFACKIIVHLFWAMTVLLQCQVMDLPIVQAGAPVCHPLLLSLLLLAGNAGSLAQAITKAAAKGASTDVLAKAAADATSASPASPAPTTGSSPVRALPLCVACSASVVEFQTRLAGTSTATASMQCTSSASCAAKSLAHTLTINPAWCFPSRTGYSCHHPVVR
jgi:hypothetical protein